MSRVTQDTHTEADNGCPLLISVCSEYVHALCVGNHEAARPPKGEQVLRLRMRPLFRCYGVGHVRWGAEVSTVFHRRRSLYEASRSRRQLALRQRRLHRLHHPSKLRQTSYGQVRSGSL